MVYYVPKKNRCNCYSTECCQYGNGQLCFASTSSQKTQTKTSTSVYSTDKTQQMGGKFKSNRQKRGSGGNSYAAYLARKTGNIKCVCNSKCVNS